MPAQPQSYSAAASLTADVSRVANDEKLVSLRRTDETQPEDKARLSNSVSFEVPGGVPASARDGQERAQASRPTAAPSQGYQHFRQLCDALLAEARRLDDYLENDKVSEEGLGITVEIEGLLEELYDCPWGEKECLKRAVVAIQTQVNNVHWTVRHVRFLADAVRHLRVRYLIDDAFVAELLSTIETHGLDRFRGTAAVPEDAKKKVRIKIEIVEEDAP